MGRLVKCKCCGEKIDKDFAYIIEKVNEKTGKTTREFYHSKEEYENNKYQKSLWLSKFLDCMIIFLVTPVFQK